MTPGEPDTAEVASAVAAVVVAVVAVVEVVVAAAVVVVVWKGVIEQRLHGGQYQPDSIKDKARKNL